MTTNPFDYVTSVSWTKKNLMRGSDNDELMEKDYKPFLTNRALSYFPDTIHIANVMNRLYDLPSRFQYEFYFHVVRARKRFSPWGKQEELEAIEIIKEYYGYNESRAREVVDILSDEQLAAMKQKLEKGGIS
jgi:hypothetical protein